MTLDSARHKPLVSRMKNTLKVICIGIFFISKFSIANSNLHHCENFLVADIETHTSVELLRKTDLIKSIRARSVFQYLQILSDAKVDTALRDNDPLSIEIMPNDRSPLNHLSLILKQIGVPVLVNSARASGLDLQNDHGPQLNLLSTDLQMSEESMGEFLTRARRVRDVEDSPNLWRAFVKNDRRFIIDSKRELSRKGRAFRKFLNSEGAGVSQAELEKSQIGLQRLFYEAVDEYVKEPGSLATQKNLCGMITTYLSSTGVPSQVESDPLGYFVSLVAMKESQWFEWQKKYYDVSKPPELLREIPDLLRLAWAAQSNGMNVRIRPEGLLISTSEGGGFKESQGIIELTGHHVFSEFFVVEGLLGPKTFKDYLRLQPKDLQISILINSSGLRVDLAEFHHFYNFLNLFEAAVDRVLELKTSLDPTSYMHMLNYKLKMVDEAIVAVWGYFDRLNTLVPDFDIDPPISVANGQDGPNYFRVQLLSGAQLGLYIGENTHLTTSKKHLFDHLSHRLNELQKTVHNAMNVFKTYEKQHRINLEEAAAYRKLVSSLNGYYDETLPPPYFKDEFTGGF